MKSIEIDFEKITNAPELALQFADYNLEEGDHLIFKYEKTAQIYLVFIIVVIAIALSIYYKMEQEYANSIIQQVFNNDNIDKLEKKIEKEFGIFINLETKEQEDWYELSGGQLLKAYSDDEPEYDLSLLRETNPLYKK